MSLIYQFPSPIPMTNGKFPQFKFAVFGDNLSAVTTAGYLNASSIQAGVPLSNADVIMALYSFNTTTQTGTFGIFTVAVSTSTGAITLSVWSDNSATAMVTNAPNVMVAPGQITLAKVNGTEAANAVTASGNAGVITTSSLTTAGGASYAITWTNTLITANSVIDLQLMGGTNTTKNITMQATAGSGTSTLTIYNNTASTALNGTLLIGYTIL